MRAPILPCSAAWFFSSQWVVGVGLLTQRLLGIQVATDMEVSMKELSESRRKFLKVAGLAAGVVLLPAALPSLHRAFQRRATTQLVLRRSPVLLTTRCTSKTTPVEIASKRIISVTSYNGQFPGPLLRFKEGQQVTVDVFNDTEVLNNCIGTGRWYPLTWMDLRRGQPFIPAHGNAGSYSLRDPQDFVSITRTIERARISTRDSTTARLVPCTSSQSTSQAAMTAKSSLC